MSKTDNVKGYNDNKKINCLSCIYGDHHLNLYKIGVFKN